MPSLPCHADRLRNAAIDAVLSEALLLAGLGPLVPYTLCVVLGAAGYGRIAPAAALEAWTADRLLADPDTRAALRALALRGRHGLSDEAISGGRRKRGGGGLKSSAAASPARLELDGDDQRARGKLQPGHHSTSMATTWCCLSGRATAPTGSHSRTLGISSPEGSVPVSAAGAPSGVARQGAEPLPRLLPASI